MKGDGLVCQISECLVLKGADVREIGFVCPPLKSRECIDLKLAETETAGGLGSVPRG